MTNILDFISKEDIEDLMKYIVKEKNIVGNSTLNYYKNNTSDSQTKLLESINILNDFSDVEKGLFFYKLSEMISCILFDNYINRKGINFRDILIIEDTYNWCRLINNNLYKRIYRDIDIFTNEELIHSLTYLYTDMVTLMERKSTGTEFTPTKIVKFMFDSIGYRGEKILNSNILEPSCGSGIFLTEAVKRIADEVKKYNDVDIMNLLIDKQILRGIDINPVNVLISKFIVIITLLESNIELTTKEISVLLKKFPIKIGNTLDLAEDIKYDYIIGNPPYIRVQSLEENYRDYIKNNFKSATGRFDLYVCFIEKCINILNLDGKINLITSNKYLTSNYGKGIRTFIKENLCIDYIFDLSDSKFFEAAVLPSIIQGTKNKSISNEKFEYYQIKQDNSNKDKVDNVDIFSKVLSLREKGVETQETYKIETSKNNQINIEFIGSVESLSNKSDQWNFGSKQHNKIKEYIENQDVIELSKVTEICVGIKTTADNVFVKPMNKDFIENNKFEKEVIYPLVTSKNVERWNINWSEGNKDSNYVLYPHKVENDKMVGVDLDLYPNVKEYIYQNESILKSRKYLMESPTRKWYECWVPQHLNKFRQPKIVTRDIVSQNCFAIDYNNMICQGNTFFITLKERYIPDILCKDKYLKFILAILNSEVMEFYQKTISGSLYAKKFRYTTSNLNRWVIPNVKNTNIDKVNRIIQIVELIMSDNNSNKDINLYEQELNQIIFELYNISKNAQSDIKDFINVNS